MSWIWTQQAGELWWNGKLISKGYAGKGRGKNNPALQAVKGIGPIPQGIWKMVGVRDSPNTGRFTISLVAQDGNQDDIHQPTGRSAFRVHGDSIKNPGTASRGCIVLPRGIREKMWYSGDRVIEVRG